MQDIFMQKALDQARLAFEQNEVPIGCVIVKDGEVVAAAHNTRHSDQVSTHHAEILAIEQACKALGSWRLLGCDLYVTLEPCPMCAGAIINSRISNVYFGAYDQKAGCCGTLMNLPSDSRFNHTCSVEGGVSEQECKDILGEFFKKKRQQKNGTKISQWDFE